MFYLNSTLNFGILPVLVFQLKVYYKVDIDRLLTSLAAQQKGTTAQWYSNKISLVLHKMIIIPKLKKCDDELIQKLENSTTSHYGYDQI